MPLTNPQQIALHAKPRAEAEALYAEAFKRKDKAALRWFAQLDRYFLLICLLNRTDCKNDWVFARCREVEADPDDRIDVWAREHYKSTIITFAGSIQEVLKDPEITIGIFSHKKPEARKFVNQIRLEFEGNKLLLQLFPEIFWRNASQEAPWWSDDGGIVVRRKGNMRESTVEASGLIEGMSTGKHFKLRIYDDMVTEETVTTPDMIKKVTERYELSEFLGARSGDNEGGRQWMPGTRYHCGDTYGVLIKRGVLIERRHAATEDGTFDGKPVFLSQKQWDRVKRNKSKSTVAAQMLLNPLAGSETKFDVKWIKSWEIRPKRLNIYILCDPSKGRTETSDLTAMGVIGIDAGRNKYVLDGAMHRMKLSRRWEMLRDFWKKWSRMPGVENVRVGYEQFGLQTDLEYFEERMEIEEISFPIDELMWPSEGRRSKEWRIERIEPDLRNGRLLFPANYRIEEDGTVNVVSDEKMLGTSIGQEMKRIREEWRVAKRIRQINEDRVLYDFVLMLIEEIGFFPYAPRDDGLDMLSRIYDMDPVAPVNYEESDRRRADLEPEAYVDS